MDVNWKSPAYLVYRAKPLLSLVCVRLFSPAASGSPCGPHLVRLGEENPVVTKLKHWMFWLQPRSKQVIGSIFNVLSIGMSFLFLWHHKMLLPCCLLPVVINAHNHTGLLFYQEQPAQQAGSSVHSRRSHSLLLFYACHVFWTVNRKETCGVFVSCKISLPITGNSNTHIHTHAHTFSWKYTVSYILSL